MLPPIPVTVIWCLLFYTTFISSPKSGEKGHCLICLFSPLTWEGCPFIEKKQNIVLYSLTLRTCCFLIMICPGPFSYCYLLCLEPGKKGQEYVRVFLQYLTHIYDLWSTGCLVNYPGFCKKWEKEKVRVMNSCRASPSQAAADQLSPLSLLSVPSLATEVPRLTVLWELKGWW